MIFFTLLHKNEKLKKFKTITQVSLIAVGFLDFLPLYSDLDQIFKNKNWCNSFNPVFVNSNKVYYIASSKALNVWKIVQRTELLP